MIQRLRTTVLAALFLTVLASPLAAQDWPQTWQEINEFQAGPTPFEPLMDWWYELARLSPEVSIRPLTVSLLSRPIKLVTIARGPITTPEDAIRSGKTIVLIVNSVHGTEPAGREASQLIARDLVSTDFGGILDDVIVLIIPDANPDGGVARRRTNEEGFDLNRDYLKLESQEIYALVKGVMNRWTPDIHIDTHHGGSAPYTLTWQGTLNPAADAELRAYPYEHIFPRMREALRAEDYDGFDYSGPRTVGGVPGWGSTSLEPRKHHVYTGLVNVIGLLFETPSNTHRIRDNGTVVEEVPSHERYYHRVRGQYLGKIAVLEVAAERREEIREVTTAARMRAIENGATYSPDDQVLLEYERISRGQDQVWIRDTDAPGGYSLETREIFLKHVPTRTTSRPLGYIMPASMAKVVPILMDHDITVHRFTDAAELELEVYHATEVIREGRFQGHYLKSVTVEKEVDTVSVGKGWFYVSAAQSRSNLIAHLMEPETEDNLITWGYTDHILAVTGPVSESADGESRTQAQRRQRVPMMRVVEHQPMPLMEVVPFNQYNRTRYFQVW